MKTFRKSTFFIGSTGRIALPALIALVLATVLVARLAVAVRGWQLGGDVVDTATVTTAPTNAATVDLASVQALGLFGGANVPAGTVPISAATTDLALALEGVVVGSDPADSVAIIVADGQQQTYHVGDPLPVGVAVTLARIEKDRVMLSNNGIEQTLWLYGDDKSPRATTAAARSAPLATSQRPAAATTADPGLASTVAPQQIKQAAARLAEIIEVSPAVANGQLVGYLLAPGSRLKDFVQLGFKTNDIITAVNGIALNDMANLPELYRLMNESGDVSFSLLRDGEPVTLQMTMAP